MENTVLLVSYFSKTLLRIPPLQVSADTLYPENNKDYNMTIEPLAMPTITVKAIVKDQNNNPVTPEWYKFEIWGDDTGTKAFDYPDTPPSGYVHPPKIVSPQLTTDTWTIDFNTATYGIYGGQAKKIKIIVKYAGQEYSQIIDRNFYIVGNSIDVTTRNNYMATVTSGEVLKMIKAVARKETGGTTDCGTHYDYGTLGNSTSHTRYPVYSYWSSTGAHDYGMVQISSTSGLLNRNVIWSWKQNISAGIGKINTDKNTSTTYLCSEVGGETASYTEQQVRLETYIKYNRGGSATYHDFKDNIWPIPNEWVISGRAGCDYADTCLSLETYN